MALKKLLPALRLRMLRLWLPKPYKQLLQPLNPYEDWISHNQMNDLRKEELLATLTEKKRLLPRISVIMPVFRPDIDLLLEAINSVRTQLFNDWQLCICDDGSKDCRLTALLDKLASQDLRICPTFLPANAGISAASNAAAALADGDVLVFLDQDDLLSPDCLGEIALSFASDPRTDFVYSDHDKIDRNGRRHSPQFKPAWSPTLLLSHMYCGHVLALRRSLFDAVGGLRSAFDGSQDYDLALRAGERARLVHHIPKVLYHWRAMPGSTAVSGAEKPGSILAGQSCLTEALVRQAIPAKAVWTATARQQNIGLFELSFSVSENPLTVIVYEDSRSTASADWLEKLSDVLPERAQVHVTRRDGKPLSERMRHLGEELVKRDLLMIRAGLNIPSAAMIEQLLGHAKCPGAGIAGPRFVDRTGRIQSAGYIVPECSDLLEPAFAGLERELNGMCYLAQVAHECEALPGHLLAIDQAHHELLGQLPPAIDDYRSLGQALCAALTERGHAPICVASCSAVADPDPIEHRLIPSRISDPWYNPNLGSAPFQFQAVRRGATPRRRSLLKLAVMAHNLDREGAQLMLLDLLSSMRRAGLCDAIVLTPRDGPLRSEFESAGLDVKLIDAPARRSTNKAIAEYVDRLAALLRAEQFDLVVANTLESYAAVLAANKAGIQSIWWQHEGGHWTYYFRKLRLPVKALAIAALGLPYRVVQVSESTRRKWLGAATRLNFEVIRNGLTMSWVSGIGRQKKDRIRIRRELGIIDSELCILLMGSVSARKGQKDVVEAMDRMDLSHATSIRVLIAGEHVDAVYCQKMAEAIKKLPINKQSRVIMLGAIDNPAIYYQAADLFVCCSRQESAPRAIIEAMAFGLPIVSTQVDGIPELLAFGENAIPYQPGDVAMLAQIISRLHSSPNDRKRLGQASRDRVLLVNDHTRMVRRFSQVIAEAAMLRSSAQFMPE